MIITVEEPQQSAQINMSFPWTSHGLHAEMILAKHRKAVKQGVWMEGILEMTE